MSEAYDFAVMRRAFRHAQFTTHLSLAVAAAFLLAAALGGLSLGVRWGPALSVFALFAALRWVRLRHERPGGDPRLASGAAVVSLLFAGGICGGIICLVGQTFAFPFIDPILSRADLAAGVRVDGMVEAATGWPWLTVLLDVAYQSSFPLVFITVLGFSWFRRADRALELCGAFNLCLLITTICSALFPAVGAFHYLGISPDVRAALPTGAGTYHLDALFALREAEAFMVDPLDMHGVATFPSFHTALALMTAAAWRDVPRVRVAMFAWQAVVIVSTIPIGGHYVVDLVGGACCWAAVHTSWRLALRRNSHAVEQTAGAAAYA